LNIQTFPPFKLGEPILSSAVAEVIHSLNKDFKVGTIVKGLLPWSDYLVYSPNNLCPLHIIGSLPEGIELSNTIGILGLTGMTAYFGLFEVGKPTKGETVVISAAGGAVGSVVGQLAKMKGCRVVGITGGKIKTEYLKKELGFDDVIDYKLFASKPEALKNAIKKACPNGVDIYFDNVGGMVSDAVQNHLNLCARIVVCGQISQYNEDATKVKGPRNDFEIIMKSATKEGFMAFKYAHLFPEAMKQMAKWLGEGKLKSKETITQGFQNSPKAFIDLLSGKNIGKTLVKC